MPCRRCQVSDGPGVDEHAVFLGLLLLLRTRHGIFELHAGVLLNLLGGACCATGLRGCCCGLSSAGAPTAVHKTGASLS